jgi:hypothetical protein
MANDMDTLATLGPAVPPGLHGSPVNEMAAQQPLRATAPHLSQWLDSRSMALSCTNVNYSLTTGLTNGCQSRWLRSPSVTAFVDQFEQRIAISGGKVFTSFDGASRQ